MTKDTATRVECPATISAAKENILVPLKAMDLSNHHKRRNGASSAVMSLLRLKIDPNVTSAFLIHLSLNYR